MVVRGTSVSSQFNLTIPLTISSDPPRGFIYYTFTVYGQSDWMSVMPYSCTRQIGKIHKCLCNVLGWQPFCDNSCHLHSAFRAKLKTPRSLFFCQFHVAYPMEFMLTATEYEIIMKDSVVQVSGTENVTWTFSETPAHGITPEMDYTLFCSKYTGKWSKQSFDPHPDQSGR